MIYEVYHLKNEYYDKYEKQALQCYNPVFFSSEKILRYGQYGELTKETIVYLINFLNRCDENIKKFMWVNYYIRFMGNDDFIYNIWELDNIPFPNEWEENFPGAINGLLYLYAYEFIEKWVQDRNLPKSISDGYFKRYKYYVELNLITHNTTGLCRLSHFLYAYATARMLLIGRLCFQFLGCRDYAEVYENEQGKRLFIALPDRMYDKYGYQSEEGKFPTYKKTENIIFGHAFTEHGNITKEPSKICLDGYKLILSPGDDVVTVHIPEGSKLSQDIVYDSMIHAERIFSKYFPSFKAFVCQTWFIDPNIRKILPKGGNLEAFANMFDVISGPDSMYHPVFEHIFKTKRCAFSELQPRNEFQQKILDYVSKGNKMYWGFGVLKKNYLERED